MSSEDEIEEEYLGGAPDPEDSAPSSPLAKARELEVTSTHRTTSTVKTTLTGRRTVLRPRAESDAQTQTSLVWKGETGDTEEYIGPAPEITHLEVPLSRFEEVMCSDKSYLSDLDAAVDSVLRDESYNQLVQNYLGTLRGDDEDEDDTSGHSSDVTTEEYILKIFASIAAHHPRTSGTHPPYNIHFVDLDQFIPNPEPHDPPELAGVFSVDKTPTGTHAEYQWKDIAILIGSGIEFEEKDQEYKAREEAVRRRKSGDEVSPSDRRGSPGPSRHSSIRPSPLRQSPSRRAPLRRSASLADSRATSVRSRSPASAQGSPRPIKPSRLRSSPYPEAETSTGFKAGRPLEETVSLPSPSDHPRGPKPPAELARCALETLSALGNRRHVLGITIARLVVRFWYFDRAGSIHTPALSVMDSSFVRALMAVTLSDSTTLGLESSFKPSLLHDELALPQFGEVLGTTLTIQGTPFVIREKLHSASELYGRGTAVYAAKRGVSKDKDNASPTPVPEDVVIKLSWQLTDWDSEDALYQLAADCDVQGISRLYRSAAITRLSRGFRGRIVDRNQYRDRELRAQVLGPLAIPLHHVKDLDTFKAAFISLVEAHHDLYEKAGILHHDISINNLMVDATNHAVGVLIDLDLAVRLKIGDTRVPFKPPPGGTLPFRAIGILKQQEPIHELYYRYDLESFFYTLIWILTYYPFASATPMGSLTGWYQGHPANIRSFKRGFLVDIKMMRDHPNPLQRHWLPRLAELFDRGYDRLLTDKHADAETMGGVVTYAAFISVIEYNYNFD